LLCKFVVAGYRQPAASEAVSRGGLTPTCPRSTVPPAARGELDRKLAERDHCDRPKVERIWEGSRMQRHSEIAISGQRASTRAPLTRGRRIRRGSPAMR
jgi:hypothetical protein